MRLKDYIARLWEIWNLWVNEDPEKLGQNPSLSFVLDQRGFTEKLAKYKEKH